MKVYCLFSLESPQRGDFNEYTQYINISFLNIKKKIILNYPKSATLEFVPRDPRKSSNQPW